MGARVPLKHLAVLNPETLGEETLPNRAFRYIDIGTTGRGVLVDEPQEMVFETSPSRARRVLRPGDTILSTVRTYLRASWTVRGTEEDLVASTGFVCLRPRTGVDPRFLGWLVQADTVIEEVVARSVGVSYPAINPADVGRIKVPCPAPPTQRAIADYLDRETARIDALTSARRQQVALLQEGIDSQLIRLVNPGENGGRLLPIRRILQKQSRAASSPGVVTAFRDGTVTLRDRRREDGFTESTTRSDYQGVRQGDVVFHGLDGFAGAIGVSVDDGICTPAYHVCDVLPGFDSGYVALALRGLALSGYLALQSGNVRERAVDFRNWNTLAQIKIPVPSFEQQHIRASAYMVRRSWTDRLVEGLRRQVGLLRERQQALVTSAVTGQLNIPETA